MNDKMTSIANDLGTWICRNYNRNYLETLFNNGICIEDVILQILVECCRCAYLVNSEKHPISYYINRDGRESELARKEIKRTIDYVNKKFDLESERLEETLGVSIPKSDVKLVKKDKNRFPKYDISEFQYWEMNNIHDMELVKSIVERRIGSSHKASFTRFRKIAGEYDSVIEEQMGRFGKDPEQTVFSSLVLFTLQTKYAFDFYYELAAEMEKTGVIEIPDMYDRLMATSGSYKCMSCLPDICPKAAHDNDRFIEYPMIIQRRRIIRNLVSDKAGGIVDLMIAGTMEANVLANAVQSHIRFKGANGTPQSVREWFVENTDLEDWASVFETYNVFTTYIPDKDWTDPRINAVERMYDMVSMDYKKLKHPENRP